jgi:hypothetical protein
VYWGEGGSLKRLKKYVSMAIRLFFTMTIDCIILENSVENKMFGWLLKVCLKQFLICLIFNEIFETVFELFSI